jgi:hypothetical protein
MPCPFHHSHLVSCSGRVLVVASRNRQRGSRGLGGTSHFDFRCEASMTSHFDFRCEWVGLGGGFIAEDT